jgi:hypothetical protein
VEGAVGTDHLPIMLTDKPSDRHRPGAEAEPTQAEKPPQHQHAR